MEDKVNEYRQKILNQISRSKELFYLVNENGDFSKEDLVWTHYFPTEFVPDTQEQEGTFICIEVDINYNQKNSCFQDFFVYFFVCTHVNTMRNPVGSGLRCDAIAYELQNLFNDSFLLGVRSGKFIYNRPYAPNNRFRGRMLRMDFRDFGFGIQ